MNSERKQSDRPNIILITTDQQRYDTLGVNGSRVSQTPNIDRLAAEGVIFEHAYVQNPICVPSRACIQTGRYTHQHGVRYMEEKVDATPGLPPWELTFMEHLQAAGYETGATGKIHMMPEKGFDWLEITGGKGQRWTEEVDERIGPAPLGPQYAAWLEARNPGAYARIYEQRRRPEYANGGGTVVNVLALEDYVESFILEKSVEFIQQPRRNPFFLWCGFCGPHGPFDPPASHADLYSPEGIPLPETLHADLSDRPEHLRKRQHWPALIARQGELTLRRWMAYYFALVTLIDDMVGQLMIKLVESGKADNTVVLYTSDHGEMLGDFGMSHKENFYESVIHVPLLVWGAGAHAMPRTFSGLVEVMGIAPTILDYADVTRPHVMQADSLRPIIEGSERGLDGVLSEFTSNDRRISGKCLRTDRYKYVLWNVADGGEFYDLHEDPLERRNLWDEPRYRDERDRHQRLLLTRLMGSERPYTGRPQHNVEAPTLPDAPHGNPRG